MMTGYTMAVVLRELVFSFEGITEPHKVTIRFEANSDYFAGTPGITFNCIESPFGDDGGGDPRVPIPNTTVKPSSADGTWTAGSWESRTSPSGRLYGAPRARLKLKRNKGL